MAVGGSCIIWTSEHYGTLLIIFSITYLSLYKVKIFYTVTLRSGYLAYFLQHFHPEIDCSMCNICEELRSHIKHLSSYSHVFNYAFV